MQKTSPEIAKLKQCIEENMKRKMRTPNDFVFLSGAVFDRVRETLSPTTLKRLWGYIEGADQTRNSTLDILSQFLGYRNWDEFVEKTGMEIYCNLFILGEPLYLSHLVQGNNPPVDFVVGNKGGLCELENIPKD